MKYINNPRWMPLLFGISLSLLVFVGCSQQSPVNSQPAKVEDQVDPPEEGLTVPQAPVRKEDDEAALTDKPSGREPRGDNGKSTALLKEWPTPGLAIVLTLAPRAAAVSMPFAIALRAVPIVTTAPLVVLLLGRGAVGGVALVAVMVFFPTLIACLEGLRRAPGQALDVLRCYAAPAGVQLVRVRIPAMLPAFFAAARMSVPAAVLAVTVVEWLALGSGVGSLMALAASRSGYDLLAGAVVVVTALSALGYALVSAVEARVLRVYAPEQAT